MALTKEQADQLAELERLRDEPDPDPDDGPGDDGGHVIVLRGSRADSFLESLLGGTSAPKRGNAASEPAKTQSKKSAPKTARQQAEQDDEDQGDEDQGDGQPGQSDAPPPRSNRYFR